jgi:transcriptional regulator with XRE-family HTH domain
MSSVFTGALLRAKIDSQHIRLEEVSVLSGLGFRYLDRLCRGHARPSIRTIELLADVLGCEPGEFFADDGKSRALPPPEGEAPVPPLRPETRERLRHLLDLRGGHGDAA